MAFKNFDWRFSFSAFGIYIVMNIFRALRFNFFLENKIGFKRFLKIVFLYNFWNQVMPFRSGELSYLYLVKKNKKVLIGENLASLVAARVFDLLVITLFALAGMFFVFKKGAPAFDINSGLWLGVGLVIFIFVSVIFLNKKIGVFFDFFLKKIGLLRFKIFSFLLERLKETLGAFSTIKSVKRFFVFLGYSACIWLVDFFVIWSMSFAAGIEVTFWQAIVSTSFLLLTIFILPFQTPVNLGTYEGSLTLVYLFFGFEKNIAVSAGLLIHIQNFVFTFILFIFAYLFMKNGLLKKT